MAESVKEILEGKPASSGETNRDEKGRFAPSTPVETPEAPAEPVETKPAEVEAKPVTETPAEKPVNADQEWRYAAYKDEKSKRQQYERELADERRERERLARELQARQEKETPPPNIFEDPDGYMGNRERKILTAIDNQRFDTSEMLARATPEGSKSVDEALEAAAELRKTDPNDPIFIKVKNARDPYRELLTWHKQQKILTEIQDPEAYKAKLREEILAELKAKDGLPAQEQQAPVAPAPANLPTDLTRARSVSGRTQPAYAGPTPLSDLIPPGGAARR